MPPLRHGGEVRRLRDVSPAPAEGGAVMDPVTDTAKRLASLAEQDLIERLVAVVMATDRKHADGIARVLRQQEDGPEADVDPAFVAEVRRVLNTVAFLDALELARENPVRHIQQRALKKAPMALEAIIGLASEHNDDKRTRTSNAQFLVSAGSGLSPTQRHELTADEAFVGLIKEYFPQKADADAA